MEARVHVQTAADVARLRQQTIAAVFGTLPTAIPASHPIPPVLGAKAARQLEPTGVYLIPRHPNGELAIYHAGHSQNALTDAAEPIRGLLADGYTVLALNMPPSPHERFHSLRPFLEPVALGLNYALAQRRFTRVTMLGLSGGGWTTAVYSALDTRITRSVPIAGTWPDYLRAQEDPALVDWEQHLPGLSVSYLDLYLMASSEGREQLQVFNSEDPCCFRGPGAFGYRDFVAAKAQALGGRFEVAVVGNTVHAVSPEALALVVGYGHDPRPIPAQ